MELSAAVTQRHAQSALFAGPWGNACIAGGTIHPVQLLQDEGWLLHPSAIHCTQLGCTTHSSKLTLTATVGSQHPSQELPAFLPVLQLLFLFFPS